MNITQVRSLVMSEFKRLLPTQVSILLGRENLEKEPTGEWTINQTRWPKIREWPQIKEYIEEQTRKGKSANDIDKEIHQIAVELEGASNKVFIGSGKPKDMPAFVINVEEMMVERTSFPAGDKRKYVLSGTIYIDCWDKEIRGYDALYLMSQAAGSCLENKRLTNTEGEVVVYSADPGGTEEHDENVTLRVTIPTEYGDRR